MSEGREKRRRQLRDAVERDLDRRQRREKGSGSFWRSLGIIGAVGWPIVLLTAGGALFGHWLDLRWDAGVRYALLLLTIGVAVGSYVAWHMVGGMRR